MRFKKCCPWSGWNERERSNTRNSGSDKKQSCSDCYAGFYNAVVKLCIHNIYLNGLMTI